MAKIDFSKVEENLKKAMHAIFVKKIESGESNVSARAVSFYRLDESTGSGVSDSVIGALEELAKGDLPEEPEEITEASGLEVDTLAPMPAVRRGAIASSESVPPAVEEVAPTMTLFSRLHRRLLWLSRNKVSKVYEQLGTTKEAVQALGKREQLTEEDTKELERLLAKAEELKQSVIEKRGIASDTSLVETERKSQQSKRFNVKKSWLPLQ